MSILDYILDSFKASQYLTNPGSAMSPVGTNAAVSKLQSGLDYGAGMQNPIKRGNTAPAVQHISPWGNISNIVNTTAQLGQKSQQDQILDQLRALSDPSRYMGDDASIDAGARAAASAQYDPVIAGLRSQAAASTKRAQKNQGDVISIFNQLSDSLHGDLPAVNKNYDDTAAKTAGDYQQLKDTIGKNYDDTQKQQEDLFNRLNIQAAAPGITPKQAENKAYFQSQADTSAQTQKDALTTEKQGAVDYVNRGSASARTEGTQRSADIMGQLTDLLNQINDKVGANESAKNQAYLAQKSSLQQSQQKNALDRSQSDFNNFLASINLGRSMNNDTIDNQVKLAGLGKNAGVKSLADIPSYVMSLGLPQDQAQNIQNTFISGLSNGLVSSGLDPSTGAQATPEAKVNQIVQQARQQGNMSEAEINALRDAALQYFGRR